MNHAEGNELEFCYGCGASFAKIDGPTHRYIGASPACWSIFGEVLAKEYEIYSYLPIHHLTIDAYAAQHPGKPSNQSIKSVAIHLISIHLMPDHHYETKQVTKLMSRAAQVSQKFIWMEPPGSPGELTLLDVYQANNLKEQTDIWAHSVWQAWQPHHQQVRNWTECQIKNL